MRFTTSLIIPYTENFQCIKEVQLSSLHGRKIAIDASMAIYQFLIAVRSGGPNHASAMLTNAEGETTSHIQVRIRRSICFIDTPFFVYQSGSSQESTRFSSTQLNIYFILLGTL